MFPNYSILHKCFKGFKTKYNGLFHSSFWIERKRSVGVKGLRLLDSYQTTCIYIKKIKFILKVSVNYQQLFNTSDMMMSGLI